MLAADGVADLILTGGTVYSVDPTQAWESSASEAIAIDDDKILAIGTEAEIIALATKTTTILDLEGRAVFPGFHDVHTHILEAFSAVNTVQLDAETPLRDLLPKLTGQQPHSATGWVLGGGQSIDQFFDLAEHPKDILDEAIPSTPAAMLEATSHSVWVNSAALAAAGIDASTADPAGGIIQRDSVTGEPTGLLIDNAVDLIFEVALAQNEQLDELNYESLLAGLETFNQFGITSVADARVYTSRGHDEVWQRAETEDELTVRANLGLWAYPQADDNQQIAELTTLYQDDPDRLVKINEVKLYSDGITENGTALFVDPYDQEILGRTNGLSYFDSNRMEQYITALEQVGYTFNIHAIGDQGVGDALTAIENAAQTNSSITDRRHRLTHAEVIDPADYSRFAASGVIADFQIGGELLQPENREFLRDLIGDRADSVLPARGLHDAGATVVFSSDFDVNTANPFVGIQQSLTRTDGQALAAVADAIEAYTINGAFAMRQDDVVGSLLTGKLADLVVLDQNLLNIPADQIDQTNALLTLMDGQSVHGNSLSLTLRNNIISENNGSTIATLTRGNADGDLEVLLSSADTSEAAVPVSVVIPDGDTSVTFRVEGVNEAVDDSNRIIPIRARATGFITAMTLVTVIDDDPLGLDFGDAPTAAQSGFANDYPVTSLSNGASHVTGTLFLGTRVDNEFDGQPTIQASGDDVILQDDEDGTTFGTTLIADADASTTLSFQVDVSTDGKLDAWIDFNRDGHWEDAGESVAKSQDVKAGLNTISFVIPIGIDPGGTAARFRLSTSGGLEPTGAAADGEVEDEWLTLLAGTPSLNAKVTTGFNAEPTGDVIIATLNGRTSVRHQATEFFSASLDSFGGLSVFGAPQDETFTFDAATLSRPARGVTLNGGGGENQLRIGGDATFSLMDEEFRIANFGVIDLTESGATTLEFDTASIQAISQAGTVTIVRGMDDQILIADAANWRFGDPVVDDGEFFRTLQNVVSGQNESVQLQSAAAWHNDLFPQDVDNSGDVTPNDILEVINQLVDRRYIQPGSETAVSPSEVADWPNRYYDTSGNNEFTPLDILEVINFLAESRSNTPSGELIATAGDGAISSLLPVANDHRESNSRTPFDEPKEVLPSEWSGAVVNISANHSEPEDRSSVAGRVSQIVSRETSEHAEMRELIWSPQTLRWLDDLLGDLPDDLSGQM